MSPDAKLQPENKPWWRKDINLCRKDHVDRKDDMNMKTTGTAKTTLRSKELEQKRIRCQKKINKPIEKLKNWKIFKEKPAKKGTKQKPVVAVKDHTRFQVLVDAGGSI